MNTDNELLNDLLAERRALQHIAGIELLSKDELCHLAQLSRILANPEDASRLASWFLDAIETELKIRDSQGQMERGYVSFQDDNYSNEELYDACLRVDFLREFSTLTQLQRSFVVNLHRKIIDAIHIRSTSNTSELELICPREAAKLLGVERGDTLRLARQGVLPKPYRLGPKLYRWRRCDVVRAIERLK